MQDAPDDSNVGSADFWLEVHFIFARCCGSSLTLPMLPKLLIQDMKNGNIEPLGWDEENGVLYAHAHSRPCSTCIRLVRAAFARGFYAMSVGLVFMDDDDDETSDGT